MVWNRQRQIENVASHRIQSQLYKALAPTYKKRGYKKYNKNTEKQYIYLKNVVNFFLTLCYTHYQCQRTRKCQK